MVSRRVVAAYIAASFVTVFLFLADYANTYRAFYPTMVALANSSAFRLLAVNTVVAATSFLWFAMQAIFFGKLNASEEVALLTSFTIYLAECIIVPLYFNLTLMSTTMVFFVFTLAWRLLHKLAEERVTTLSTVQLTLFPVSRMVAYFNFVLIGDVGLLLWLVQTRPDLGNDLASLHYSLLLIYALLLTSSLRSLVRFGSLFVLHGRHTLLPFVADAVTSIAESALFVSVYAYIFWKSTLPLLLLRGFIGHVLRIFEKASGLVEFLMLARKVRHDMPNATAEDLAHDARCTICYEDMVPGNGTKRLPCGHCYHTDCLEHWLEGHSTCPYCRANIMRMPNNAAAAVENVDTAPADQPAAQDGRRAGPEPAAQALGPENRDFQQQLHRLTEQQQQQAAEDPFATRLHNFTVQHAATATPEAPEAELRAAYQRYLNRVDPTNPNSNSSNSNGDRSLTEEAVEAAKKDRAVVAPQQRPPAAQVHTPSENFGIPSPVPDLKVDLPPPAASAATPQLTSKTVDQKKLKAYKKYHKRLREAEKELMQALRQAEEHSSTA
jgi:E3 ubiquitin-protein ligase synoviolin